MCVVYDRDLTVGNLFDIQKHADKGTDVNAREPKSGSTPLTLAASRGDKDMVWALLDCGAEVNSQSDTGWTALHHAAFFGHNETAWITIPMARRIERR